MPPPIILLPPSERKAPGGDGAAWLPGSISFPELDASRHKIAAALKRVSRQSAAVNAKLLGVKGDALAAARATNSDVLGAPTMPTLDRYTGVLYDALDHTTLTATQRRRAGAQLVVFSALWGIVRPDDLLPDYKLKMGASVAPMGRLATFWRPQISAALAPVVADRTVWDLLPHEHAAAWNPAQDATRRRISVKFLDDVTDGAGRKFVSVSHWNKLLKGALVRHVLATQLDDPEGLAEFEHPLGYRYDPSLTVVAGPTTTVALVARRD